MAEHASWCCHAPARIMVANAVSKTANNSHGAKNAIDAQAVEVRRPIEANVRIERFIDGLNC